MDFTTYLLALLVLGSITTVVWMVSLAKRDVSIIDPVWPLLFLTAAGTYALQASAEFDSSSELTARAWLVLATHALWTLRLGGYLAWRKTGEPEDRRYRAMRERREGFAWKSLFIVFWLQAGIAWFVSLPLLPAIHSAAPLGALDIAGLVVWTVGFCFEGVGDFQLARFKARPDSSNAVMNRGLWRFSRHPNYFGNFCMVWGWFLMALSTGAWWSVPAPLFMSFMLLKVSGVSLLEGDIEERRPNYRDYMQRTNAFFPGPPRKA